MRRCVWSRNLMNEEAMARVGPQRHRRRKKKCPYSDYRNMNGNFKTSIHVLSHGILCILMHRQKATPVCCYDRAESYSDPRLYCAYVAVCVQRPLYVTEICSGNHSAWQSVISSLCRYLSFSLCLCRYVYLSIQRLNFTCTIPKCLKYRNKGKDHDSQTQQCFIKFLKYISNNMGYMFRLTSSHLRALKV